MDQDVAARVTAARKIADDIARIGSAEHPSSSVQQQGNNLNHHAEGEGQGHNQQSQTGRSTHVSESLATSGSARSNPPTNPVTLNFPPGSRNLAECLRVTKGCLLDLGERQLNDIIDEAQLGARADINDMDGLLAEMRTVRTCVEAMIMLEASL